MEESSDSSRSRPAIPANVKRQVRRRCGFGCVVCGALLYEYDHLHGWANTHTHEPSGIVLLCDQHHREKTVGLLPIDRVIAANENPANRKKRESAAHVLHYHGSEYEVSLAGMKFVVPASRVGSLLVPLMIDDEPIVIFRVEDEHLLLSFNYYDESNRLALRIKNNELVYRTDVWDIEFIGKNLKLRKGKREIILDLAFEPPTKIAIDCARINRNGVTIIVDSDFVHVPNMNAKVGKIGAFRSQVGIVAGRISEETTKVAAITFPISESDRLP